MFHQGLICLQVGRAGKGMLAKRGQMAKLAEKLQAGRSLPSPAKAAAAAYKASSLRLTWIDAGQLALLSAP